MHSLKIFLNFSFWDSLQYSPGWLQNHYIAEADLEFLILLHPALERWHLQMWAAMPGFLQLLDIESMYFLRKPSTNWATPTDPSLSSCLLSTSVHPSLGAALCSSPIFLFQRCSAPWSFLTISPDAFILLLYMKGTEDWEGRRWSSTQHLAVAASLELHQEHFLYRTSSHVDPT